MNLQAVVRCRPPIEKDIIKNIGECVSVISDNALIVTETYDAEGHTGSDNSRRLQFEFSKVFSKVSTNQEIYNYAVKPLLPGLFEGLNATVFAYGAAGSGKSFTIMGSNETPGLIGQSVNDLLSLMD